MGQDNTLTKIFSKELNIKGGIIMYQHKTPKGNLYILHSLLVKLKGSGIKQRIYYFSKKGGKTAIDELPRGYTIIHSRKTGLPLLKKS